MTASTMTYAPRFALVVLVGALLACSQAPSPPASTDASGAAQDTSEPATALGRAVSRGIGEAKEKLATENISVSSDQADSLAKAEITPQGDLLIDGRAVQIDAEQRRLLLDYRASIVGIAEAGMDVGVQGADVAMSAMSEALGSVLTGNFDQIDRRVEAKVEEQTRKIEASAEKLCGNLPVMFQAQQELAAALPEFKPYATMTQQDVDDCHVVQHRDSAAQRAEIRDNIRSGIRSGIREAVGAATPGDEASVAQDEPVADAESIAP